MAQYRLYILRGKWVEYTNSKDFNQLFWLYETYLKDRKEPVKITKVSLREKVVFDSREVNELE